MGKEYFKVMFVQMKLTLNYDEEKEFLVANDEYFNQMEKIIERIKMNCYDVILFPELAYHDKYDEYFKSISKNKIIVFGSVYVDNYNYTVVYSNNEKKYIKKIFCSPVEPAIRYLENINIKTFFKDYFSEHIFKLKGKKFVILNCAEYYKVAYYIARDERYNKNLFGFLVPCANNKVSVFLDESMAIHNHNESIYSFVVNSVSLYNSKEYSFGESYVYGKISSFEKNCLDKKYRRDNSNIICYLDKGVYVVEGEFLCCDDDKYCRSDCYKHTPKNFKIIEIGEI